MGISCFSANSRDVDESIGLKGVFDFFVHVLLIPRLVDVRPRFGVQNVR
jgi:hypothetical protein